MDKEGRDIVNIHSPSSARKRAIFARRWRTMWTIPIAPTAPTRSIAAERPRARNELHLQNDHPNIVVLVEGTMVKGWDYIADAAGDRLGITHALTRRVHVSICAAPTGWRTGFAWMQLSWRSYNLLFTYRLGSWGLDRFQRKRRARQKRSRRISQLR